MNLVPMRFKGVEWHHNPREISFSCEQNVSELLSPFGISYIQNTGRKSTVIRGEGELYGEDCAEQFSRLLSLLKSGGTCSPTALCSERSWKKRASMCRCAVSPPQAIRFGISLTASAFRSTRWCGSTPGSGGPTRILTEWKWRYAEI